MGQTEATMPKQAKIMHEIVRQYELPEMKVWRLPETDRAKFLGVKASFVRLCQHDHHGAAWNGASRDPGVGYLRERMEPAGFVPTNAAVSAKWDARKPDTPHGLPRQVVTRFTDMLLGDQGRPTLAVPSDPATEAYVEAVMAESKTWASLLQARDIKGARGSAAIVPSVVDGRPTSEPLRPEHLWVREWMNKAEWIPKSVVEQKLVNVTIVDEEEGSKQLKNVRMWRTRYWDDEVAVTYRDVPEDWDKDDPDREIPAEEVVHHKLSRCPVVWMQNTRNTESPEGDEDMTGAYAQSDKLDRVRSFATRSTIANTDPTLHIKDEEQRLRRNPLREKGHGKKIETGPKGDAKLLETSGQAVEQAWSTASELRHDILQTVGCMIPDPETIKGRSGALSGEALAILWRAMESRCDRLRVPLEDEIRQVARIWIELGTTFGVTSIEDERDGNEDKGGIILPPRVIPGDGDESSFEPHSIGEGRWVKVVWGPYHRLTASQLQALVGALTTANGAKAVISQETAMTILLNALTLGSPAEEMARMQSERERAAESFGLGLPADAGDDDGDDDDDDDGDDDAQAEVDAAQAEVAKAETQQSGGA